MLTHGSRGESIAPTACTRVRVSSRAPGLARQSHCLRVTDSLQIASNLDSRMLFGLKNVLLKKKKGKREAGVRREVKGGFALPFRTALCIFGEEAAAARCRRLSDVERVPSTRLSRG